MLKVTEQIGESQGLIPRGATVKQIKSVLYDEGFGMMESPEITGLLMNLRRRKLIMSRPGGDGALWMCTLYGRNVVTA